MSEIDIYKHIGQQMISDREKIKELEVEIQELQDAVVWWNNRYNALQRDYEDYKTRCEKADEYIENAQERDGDEESCSLHVPTLKSILESRSDK